MAMKFFQDELSDESSRLELLLVAIDSIIFGDDSESSVSNFDQLCNDENLKSDCFAWKERFSKPDAEKVKYKWYAFGCLIVFL